MHCLGDHSIEDRGNRERTRLGRTRLGNLDRLGRLRLIAVILDGIGEICTDLPHFDRAQIVIVKVPYRDSVRLLCAAHGSSRTVCPGRRSSRPTGETPRLFSLESGIVFVQTLTLGQGLLPHWRSSSRATNRFSGSTASYCRRARSVSYPARSSRCFQCRCSRSRSRSARSAARRLNTSDAGSTAWSTSDSISRSGYAATRLWPREPPYS